MPKRRPGSTPARSARPTGARSAATMQGGSSACLKPFAPAAAAPHPVRRSHKPPNPKTRIAVKKLYCPLANVRGREFPAEEANMPVPERNAADTLDVTALIDRGGLGGFQVRIVVLCGLVALLDGADTT